MLPCPAGFQFFDKLGSGEFLHPCSHVYLITCLIKHRSRIKDEHISPLDDSCLPRAGYCHSCEQGSLCTRNPSRGPSRLLSQALLAMV
jgi:hypothetical protein